MKLIHHTKSAICHIPTPSFTAKATSIIGKFIGLCMMCLLVSCGEDRPKGLRLITIQEKQVANIPRVTILDFDEEPPKRIELSDGETKDGIELVEVDFAKRTALIRRNGEEVRLVMNGAEQ
jgi:hypothetical protein